MTATSSGRRSLSFGRRLAATLMATALLPLVLFGIIAIGRVDIALTAAADARIRDAMMAVDGILADREQRLIATATAYADWGVTRTLIETGDTATIQRDILGFLESRGPADVALAILDGTPLTTGDRAETIALAAAAVDGSGPTGSVEVGGALFQFAVTPIGGVTAAASGGASADLMVVADRLDASFVHDVRRLTGFDIAVIDAAGRVSVAGDPTAAAAFADRVTTSYGTASEDGTAAGWFRVDGAAGGAALLVTTREATVRALIGQLPAVLLVMLGIAALGSLVIAWQVSRGLNLRLSAIHTGLTAVAAGRRPTQLPTGGGRDVDRLADALDGLVEASDRRERILREASVTVAELRPDVGAPAVARAAVEGAVDIFRLLSCSLLAADGTVLAAAPEHVDGPGMGIGASVGRLVEAPLGSIGDDSGWLSGIAPPEPPWTDADDVLFGLYGRLIGGALHDARVYDVTTDRLEELARMHEFQRQFLRSVSHNLQTPLTTISLVADDLADPATSSTPGYRQRQVRVIRAQAKRLERMVAQLITVSRLDAGRLRLERDAVAVEPLVRRVWAALDSDRPFEVDDAAGDHMVVGDREAIEQVLWILLDNAVRYAPTGPVHVSLVAEEPGRVDPATDAARDAGPRIRIEVADHGPGVAEAERRNIFRRFWSGAAGRGQGGTGIGLDIARRLSRAMGGSLRYRPGQPVGAVFVVTLPAEVARPD